MKSKYIYIFIISCYSLFAQDIYAINTETVSDNSYTHIQTYTSYHTDVFSARSVLGIIGYTERFSKKASSLDDIHIINDVVAKGEYGGLLLWCSHGGTGFVMVEGVGRQAL